MAAAWADHEVSNEEINNLKDLLFRLPELTGREWAMLEMYIESPVGDAERERLVDQLKGQLQSAADKALAKQALEELASADGVVTDEERAVVDSIKTEIDSVSVGVFGQVGRLVSGSVSRREQALREAPNREDHFEDYIKNKVYFGVQLRMEGDDGKAVSLDIPDAELRLLSLAGGLMARVAHVDLEIADDEIAAMVKALEEGWKLRSDQAAFVVEVAVSEIGPDMDYYRLTREFFESTSEEQRAEFLKVLFAVGDADGRVSNEEIEEIRTIANALRLPHKYFIDAKLTIPKERRAS
ncbi:MAG: TerB family tellurite resistance protein [Anaerolineales bacterium]